MVGRMQSLMVVTALVAGLAGSAGPVAAEERFVTDFGLGMGAVGANLLYMPAKLVYATLGGVTGGLAYGLTGGNLDVGRAVWTPSLGGTYVVTPGMLLGTDVIYFSGVTQRRPQPGAVVRAEAVRPPRGEPAGGY